MLNLQKPRVAILSSSRSPGLDVLLRDPNRGTLYELSVVVAGEDDYAGQQAVTAAGIPFVPVPIRAFHRERNFSLRNLVHRRDYDNEVAAVLRAYDTDLVFLSTYRYIITQPLLERYENRIFNIHDSDLSVLDDQGHRKYTGLRSTRDAIVEGERETRATVHIVCPEVDGGPLMLVSNPFPVAPLVRDAISWGAWDLVKAYAYAHREWVIHSSWGPLMKRTLELMSVGSVDLVDGTAWVDGRPGPCQFDGAAICDSLPRPPQICPFLQHHHPGWS